MVVDTAVLTLARGTKACLVSKNLSSTLAIHCRLLVRKQGPFKAWTCENDFVVEVSGERSNAAFSFPFHNGASQFTCSMQLLRNTSAGWGEKNWGVMGGFNRVSVVLITCFLHCYKKQWIRISYCVCRKTPGWHPIITHHWTLNRLVELLWQPKKPEQI